MKQPDDKEGIAYWERQELEEERVRIQRAKERIRMVKLARSETEPMRRLRDITESNVQKVCDVRCYLTKEELDLQARLEKQVRLRWDVHSYRWERLAEGEAQA